MPGPSTPVACSNTNAASTSTPMMISQMGGPVELSGDGSLCDSVAGASCSDGVLAVSWSGRPWCTGILLWVDPGSGDIAARGGDRSAADGDGGVEGQQQQPDGGGGEVRCGLGHDGSGDRAGGRSGEEIGDGGGGPGEGSPRQKKPTG